jgi:low temperature requirement protein LtrA
VIALYRVADHTSIVKNQYGDKGSAFQLWFLAAMAALMLMAIFNSLGFNHCWWP